MAKQKYRIKANGKELMFLPKALVMGLDDKKVKLKVLGGLSFEETMDLLATSQLEILNYFKQHIEEQVANEEELNKGRKEIYDRAVWGFSLMIDQFYPEGKDEKFAGLTDKDILRAQNEVLRDRQKKA